MTSVSSVSPQIDHDGVISSITVKGLSKTAALTLDHALVHVWREAQLARTCEEHEDFEIALKLLGLLHRGRSGPGLFNLACALVTGLPHAKYVYRRAERAEFMRLEMLRCVPDYDYSREPKIGLDLADGRRHFGNNFASHGMDTQAIKEAAAKLGINKTAIYGRLRRGWTWEQASSETRISGRRNPFRFRNGSGKLQRDIAPSIALIDSLVEPHKDLGKLPVDTQIANGPTLNTNEDAPLTLARLEQLRKAGRSSWSASVRAKRKQRLAGPSGWTDRPPQENLGKKLLDSVSDYLYGEAQGARNAFERDSYTLALRLLVAVRRGDPSPLVSASYAAFGSSFPIYVQRRADRQWLAHQELIRSLPQEKKSGHKLFFMASSRVTGTNSTATGEANPPPSPARERLGDRATANRRELATVIEWPESPGVGDIASRGSSK
jgi:hypothetical protein